MNLSREKKNCVPLKDNSLVHIHVSFAIQKASNNILMSIIFKIINYCTVCHKIKKYNSVLKSSLEPKVYIAVTSFLAIPQLKFAL